MGCRSSTPPPSTLLALLLLLRYRHRGCTIVSRCTQPLVPPLPSRCSTFVYAAHTGEHTLPGVLLHTVHTLRCHSSPCHPRAHAHVRTVLLLYSNAGHHTHGQSRKMPRGSRPRFEASHPTPLPLSSSSSKILSYYLPLFPVILPILPIHRVYLIPYPHHHPAPSCHHASSPCLMPWRGVQSPRCGWWRRPPQRRSSSRLGRSGRSGRCRGVPGWWRGGGPSPPRTP